MPPRVMCVEDKHAGLTGRARIGRVTFSQTGSTLYYRGKTFQSLKGQGYKANYFEVESGDEYWISGPKRDGSDGLYTSDTDIDDDVREECWTTLRNQPQNVNANVKRVRGPEKHVR